MNFKLCRTLILVASVSIFYGCSNSSSGTAKNITPTSTPVTPPATTPPAVVSTNACATPVTKVIDYGERATVSTPPLRGAYSDIAIQPTTNYPVTIYNDAGSLNLKFMFWDGVKYNLEIVSSGLAYQWMRVVFLSDGRPLVFWTNGLTGIYMAARNSATLTSAGTWTVTLLENVATTTARALEVSVSPNNQVGIFYINSAGTTARALFCNSSCDVATNYSGMGVVGNSIVATASATATAADIAWCNAGGGNYIPLVAFPGTAQSQVARCNQTNSSLCTTPGNWVAANITDGTNATSGGQGAVRLSISPVAGQKFYAIARRNSLDVRIFEQNVADCAAGALAQAATSRIIVTSATVGSVYYNFVRDASNNSHFIANDGTTNIRYANEVTGNLMSAWNANANVETATIFAASRGGAVVDSNSDQVLFTYGRSNGAPAQTFNNIVLGYTNCPAGGAGCLASTLASPSNAAGYGFGNLPLDFSGTMQLATAIQPNSISLTVTSTGVPAVAYIDYSNGAATTGRLKYRIRAGPLATDSWAVADIGTAAAPHNVSLAFDSSDKPWIGYYDSNTLRYFLATNNQTDGSGIWYQYQFPTAAAVAATLPGSNSVEVAMYRTTPTAVSKPMLIISNSGAATKIIRAALFDTLTETWQNNTIVDSSGSNNFSKLAVDFDTNGNIVLAYYDATANAVRYASTSNGGVLWTTATAITTGAGGMGIDIKINTTTTPPRPGISFYDRVNNLVRYMNCTSTTTLAACANIASWANLGIGILDSSAGISGLAAATDGLLGAGLSFSLDGYPTVVYSHGAGSSAANLMIASATAAVPFFTGSSVFNSGINAVVATPVAATPANFGAGGWNVSSARSPVTGSLHTAYVGPGNFLYVTSCGN